MKIELLRKQWGEYQNLVPTERIAEALQQPQILLDEEIENVLPNITLGTDGPIVQSIIFFSATYIGEARLIDGQEHFDVAIRNTVANYRIQLGRHEIVRNAAAIEAAKAKGEALPAADKATYETAVIILRHSIALVTEINYFGQNRSEWLKRVNALIPVQILKWSHQSSSE
jgi:hypothetical protein